MNAIVNKNFTASREIKPESPRLFRKIENWFLRQLVTMGQVKNVKT